MSVVHSCSFLDIKNHLKIDLAHMQAMLAFVFYIQWGPSRARPYIQKTCPLALSGFSIGQSLSASILTIVAAYNSKLVFGVFALDGTPSSPTLFYATGSVSIFELIIGVFR